MAVLQYLLRGQKKMTAFQDKRSFPSADSVRFWWHKWESLSAEYMVKACNRPKCRRYPTRHHSKINFKYGVWGMGGLLLATVRQRESPLPGRHWVLQRLLPLSCVRCHGSSMFTYWSQLPMQIIAAIITLFIPAFGARSWFFSIDPAAGSFVWLFLLVVECISVWSV